MRLEVDTDQLAQKAVAAYRAEEGRINAETEGKIRAGLNQNRSDYRREAQDRATTQARNQR
jgi:hypothetical protein